MARPTKYNKAILEKANEYIETYKELGHMIPSVEGLCIHIGIARSTVYKWAEEKDKKDFSDTLEQINEYQKFDLLNGGLSGQFNSNITKLALGNHGLSDKRELTGADGKDLIPSGIDTTYE